MFMNVCVHVYMYAPLESIGLFIIRFVSISVHETLQCSLLICKIMSRIIKGAPHWPLLHLHLDDLLALLCR